MSGAEVALLSWHADTSPHCPPCTMLAHSPPTPSPTSPRPAPLAGDLGRSRPSLGDLLGGCQAQIVTLDVAEIHMQFGA